MKKRHRKRWALLSALLISTCIVAGTAIMLLPLVWNNQNGNQVSNQKAASSRQAPRSSPSSQTQNKPTSSNRPAQQSVPVSSSPKVPTSTDNSCFQNSAFLGNSIIDDLGTFNLIDNAAFYARTGLTVTTIFTKSTTTGHMPIIDELKTKHFSKVYIMLGLNELGWAYSDIFIKDYAKVIDAIKQRQPTAKIYVLSILPISAKISAENKDNCNNARIKEYNIQIQKMAASKKVIYLNAASSVTDSKGCLYADAAYDGIHPNLNYSKIWVNYLRIHTA